MKLYPKKYEDISCIRIKHEQLDRVGARTGTVIDLVNTFKSFYKETSKVLFDIIIKQVWLELQMTFDKKIRLSRVGNSYHEDKAYGLFMKSMVGTNQKIITGNNMYTIVASYLPEMFPDFLSHNPFFEPEYYVYPFEHVTLDFLAFVQKHHQRLEMLQYAEEREMSIMDFENWATNQAYCYNEEIDEEVYLLSTRVNGWKYIRKMNETLEQKQQSRLFKQPI
jgi:hypothetical protein